MLHVKLIEPPCTERYARWCERSKIPHQEEFSPTRLCPFYYIDYSLASMGALEYYIRSIDDRETAWEDYFRLCSLGGSKGYFELLKEGHLSNPFKAGTVEHIMKVLKEKVLQ